MSHVPEKLGAEYYRGFLNRQGRDCYDHILGQLNKKDYSGVSSSVAIRDISSAASDCFAAYKAVRDDHPEFFFLGFQSEFTRIGHKGILRYPILYSEDIIERVQYQVRKSVCQLVRGTAGLPVIEREILVYERIAKKLSYNNHGDVRDHNIVGPILYDAGVCEGYNALLMLCFRRIGIPCVKVYGKTKTDGWHCWTVAWINGEAVHCDVTWDSPDEEAGIVWFNYFNLSAKQISVNHYEFSGKEVPACVSERLNYHRYKGLSVNSTAELIDRMEQDLTASAQSLLHLNYCPKQKDPMSEVKSAFKKSRLFGSISIHTCADLNNVLIVRKL